MVKGAHLLALVLGVTAVAGAQVVVGDVYSSDASIKGIIMLAGAGTRVFSGSQVGAGASPAVLRLARGGAVRICPGTTLTVSASASGTELLFSVSNGALEFHYTVASASDSIVTPDFQLRLTGPGDYHLGIGADQRGATCVRGLQGNNAPVTVYEMLGEGQYRVQGRDEVVFRDGRVSSVQRGALAHCGCPEPPPPVLLAETKPVEVATPAPAPEPPSTPPAPENQPHVEVDAPFVFHGDKIQQDAAYQVLRLAARNGNTISLQLEPTVVPPPELAAKQPAKPKTTVNAEKKSGGFFKKLGGFFARIFHG